MSQHLKFVDNVSRKLAFFRWLRGQSCKISFIWRLKLSLSYYDVLLNNPNLPEWFCLGLPQLGLHRSWSDMKVDQIFPYNPSFQIRRYQETILKSPRFINTYILKAFNRFFSSRKAWISKRFKLTLQTLNLIPLMNIIININEAQLYKMFFFDWRTWVL